MSLYSLFETDSSKEVQGFELTLYDGDFEIVCILARAGGSNKRFANRLSALLKPYERAMRSGSLSDEKSAEIMSQALAETVVVDWKNVQDREGNDLPCTVENVKQILMDLPELRQVVFDESQNHANFAAEQTEENAGN